jgi:hypothetical protein
VHFPAIKSAKGSNTAQFGKKNPKFRSNILLPFSKSKSKPCKNHWGAGGKETLGFFRATWRHSPDNLQSSPIRMDPYWSGYIQFISWVSALLCMPNNGLLERPKHVATLFRIKTRDNIMYLLWPYPSTVVRRLFPTYFNKDVSFAFSYLLHLQLSNTQIHSNKTSQRRTLSLLLNSNGEYVTPWQARLRRRNKAPCSMFPLRGSIYGSWKKPTRTSKWEWSNVNASQAYHDICTMLLLLLLLLPLTG